jgi:hypothetical protein
MMKLSVTTTSLARLLLGATLLATLSCNRDGGEEAAREALESQGIEVDSITPNDGLFDFEGSREGQRCTGFVAVNGDTSTVTASCAPLAPEADPSASTAAGVSVTGPTGDSDGAALIAGPVGLDVEGMRFLLTDPGIASGDSVGFRVEHALSAAGPWTLVAEDIDTANVSGRYQLRMTQPEGGWLPGFYRTTPARVDRDEEFTDFQIAGTVSAPLRVLGPYAEIPSTEQLVTSLPQASAGDVSVHFSAVPSTYSDTAGSATLYAMQNGTRTSSLTIVQLSQSNGARSFQIGNASGMFVGSYMMVVELDGESVEHVFTLR